MAKTKNKKGLSERVHKKKKHFEKKVNPFEIKFNRSKQNVLGKKVTKFDKGMPGVARSKAIKKRESTLLLEFKKRGSANTLVDKRIGEQNPDLSIEEKMLARFAAEKKKSHAKAALFNLNDDDDELTHYGQSLAEIEKFDDKAELSDAEEDEETAKLMAQEQFGGFLTRRDLEEGNAPKHKSWKDRMDEIIAQSKKAKHERQTERDKSQELTDQVDVQWKDLQSLIVTSGRNTSNTESQKPANDDYDIMVRELKFEITGKPADRMKSEEELAQEERERLHILEADRLRRMKGLVDDPNQANSKHVSADDLDDGFDLNRKRRQQVNAPLHYKDGKLVTSDSDESADDDVAIGDEDEEISEGSESEEEEIDNRFVSNDRSKATKTGRKDIGQKKARKRADNSDCVETNGADEAEKIEDEDGEEDDEEDDNDEDDDSYSDLDMESDEDTNKDDEDDEHDEKTQFIEKLLKRKMLMEAARTEVPYTFEAPETYDAFEKLLQDYSDTDKALVVERLRKCTHHSLNEANKVKLQKILEFLIEHVLKLCTDTTLPNFALVDALVGHVYAMTQQFPQTTAKKMAAVLSERQAWFATMCGNKSWKGVFPGLDTLILFKLVSLLFPTSDFTHRIATPAMIFMAHIFNQSPVRELTDVAIGLFMCTIYLEYQVMSKRLMPEMVNFLHSVLFLAANVTDKKAIAVFPPVNPLADQVDCLVIKIKHMKSNIGKLKISDAIRSEDEKMLTNDDFRLRAIKLTLTLIDRFVDLYKETAAFSQLFHPIREILPRLPHHNYPKQLQALHAGLLTKLTTPRHLTHLSKERSKPKSLRLLEPKFDEVFDDRKKRGGSRDFKEKQTLLHKLKKEKKGALREIRKDTQFLARVKLRETMQKDAERKRKVKEIHGMLANQEGDFKALKRGRKPR